MSFVMTLEVDVDQNPDAIGEALRSSFFDEKVRMNGGHPYRETGCYSTFDWQKDVEELPDLLVYPEHNHPAGEEAEDLCWCCANEGMKWTRGKKNGIECRYYWDGDGVLAFQLPDKRWLVNYDCKKDHEWMLVDDESSLA